MDFLFNESKDVFLECLNAVNICASKDKITVNAI